MLQGSIKEISGNINAITGYKDDVFIVCSSFEERTTAVAERMGEKYRVENSFVFKYDEKNRTNLRELNFNKLVNILTQHTDKILPIICDHHDPLDGILKFTKLCNEQSIELKNKNITVDITTFTKQYLLVLLKYLEKQNPRTVRLFYTEPGDYSVKWDKPLSYGIVDIVSVPTYGGRFYLEKENLLILLLGYEGDRAYSIWERFAPHKTIVTIGKPSYKESWEGRVEKFNRRLLSKLPEDCVIYIPTLDPFSMSRKLQKLIEKYSPKFNIAISPLGPKPQVIGCYLAVRNYPDIQIIYGIPKFHEEEYFSKKVGKIWEYR